MALDLMSSGAEKRTKFFSSSPYRSTVFVVNMILGAALLLADITIMVRHWHSLSEDTLTYLAFWVGLIAIVGPFATYIQTYSELHVPCQGAVGLNNVGVSRLDDAVRISTKALDGQMLQYSAVMFALMLFVTIHSGNR